MSEEVAPYRGGFVPTVKWPFVALAGAIFLGVAITALLVGGIFQLESGGSGVVYKVNRFTGQTWFCAGTSCEPIITQPTGTRAARFERAMHPTRQTPVAGTPPAIPDTFTATFPPGTTPEEMEAAVNEQFPAQSPNKDKGKTSYHLADIAPGELICDAVPPPTATEAWKRLHCKKASDMP
jgi:hypothetical protein